MANEEVEELDLEEIDEKEEEAPVKSGNGLVLLIVFFVISSAAVGYGMWYLMNKKFDARQEKIAEEKAIEEIDSTAILDSIQQAKEDSIQQAVEAEKAERERLRKEQEEKIKAAMDSTKQLRDSRVKKVAKIISSMEPEMAAGVLQSMEDSLAAQIILYMQTRSSGEILSEVNPKKVSNVSKKMIDK
ncbi:MAG: MotE family protein [Candidatus Zixiibacteriota bacterium]